MTEYPYAADFIVAPFREPPYEHQIEEFEQHVGKEARALLWTMRTGKSKMTIDTACQLFLNGGDMGKIDGVLVFAPNGVHANWLERELPRHCWPGVECETIVWRSRVAGSKGGNRLSKAAAEAWAFDQEMWWDKLKDIRKSKKLFWMSVNTESMTRDDVRRAVARFLKWRWCLIVFDESDDFGAPGSIRTKMARALSRRAIYKRDLTGTLLEGSPLAAWSQFELLKEGALGFGKFSDFDSYFASYELRSTRAGRQYPALTGFKNLEELRERIAVYSSVVTRDMVKGMPALVPTKLRIELSEEQRAVYAETMKTYLVNVGEEQVSLGERMTRLTKLQQICSGFVIDEHKRTHVIPGRNPRLEALSREVYLSPGKVIIWCQFQKDIDLVEAQLLQDGHRVVGYHGRVPDDVKPLNLTAFREEKGVKAIIGHIQSGGRGLDMSVAHKIINYSHTFKARLRAQAEERATAIGGHNIEVQDFEAPGPDEYILSKILERIDIAEAIAGTGLRDFLKSLEL
ncbi:hypothetical protein JQ608_06880 [Bradyrhizobium liaoningense]|uniref:helicase-related protein n=1 Tax=Bradyrhizobium liaoningense TaxID=43992 RepID=UPI001BA43CFE|nr:helicase-related protein [Bradyrhizobium liaoningense]MBR0876926.1 hypothetical protein [Bradyrhizobium liaoningense]